MILTPAEAAPIAGIASILIWCSTGPQTYYTVRSKLTRDNKFSNLVFCVGSLIGWTIYAYVTAQWVFVVGDGIDCALWSTVLVIKIRNIKRKKDTWKE